MIELEIIFIIFVGVLLAYTTSSSSSQLGVSEVDAQGAKPPTPAALDIITNIEQLVISKQYENDEEYEGMVLSSDGKKNGKGTMTYTNGDEYSGDLVDDMKHGYGKYQFSNGHIYEGEFLHDKKHGRGVFTSSAGHIYTGLFVNDVKHGQGRYKFSDGSEYNGEFANNQMNGHGFLRTANGNAYEGYFSADAMQGDGMYSFTTGDVYIGAYVANKRHGRGMWRFPDGNVFTGFFADDKFGSGTLLVKSEDSGSTTFDAVFSGGDEIVQGARVYEVTLKKQGTGELYRSGKFSRGSFLK